MLHYFVEICAFYLPVICGNVLIHSVWSRVGCDIPIDFGCETKHGSRIIGDSRGLSSAIFWLSCAFCVGSFQGRIVEAIYLGAGAHTGTLVSSFVKRRLRIERGEDCIPLDQIDWILGASLFYYSAFELKLNTFVGGLLILGLLHSLVNLFLRPFWERLLRKL